MKAYYENHKEQRRAYDKAYRESHKEQRRAYQEAYNQTPQGKKSSTINCWKRSGLIHSDFDELYENYLNSTHCDVCKSEYKDSFDRCMDHDHETGEFRQFLCRDCNRNDSWMKVALGT